MTVQTITLTYNSTTRTLTASPQSIGTTADVSSSRFAFTPSSGDVADIVFCASIPYLRTGRLDYPFIRIDSNGYAVIPGAIMSRLKDDDVDIYLKLTHADGTVETSGRLTMKVVTVGNTPSESDTEGVIMIRGGSWEWKIGVTYAKGSVASKGNYVYVSLADGNIGHDPSEAGSVYWISVTGSQGPQGPQGQTGPQGPPGPPLDIKHIYSSYQQMQADYDNPDYEFGDMVLISSTVSDPYNSQIYTHGTTAWVFFTDMSGAQGIQGPPGADGSPGAPFSIYKTYASVSAMESDHASVSSGAFVVISSSTAENGCLFKRQDVASPESPSTAHFLFIVSMAGPTGPQGPQGQTGAGLPSGGQTDYVLAKNSDTDYDYKWVAQGSAPVSSVNGKTGVVVLDTDDVSEGSTNKYMTVSERSKLSGIAAGAEANVQSDWSQSDADSDSFIKNKPSIPTALYQLTDNSSSRHVSDAEKGVWNGKQNALTFDDAPTSGSDNPVKSGGVYQAIATAVGSAMKYKGTCTAAELAQKTGMVVGDMWNVSTDFIIGGTTYPAGTNVAWNGTAWDPMTGVVTGFVPTSRTVNSKPLSADVTLNADDLADGSTKVMMLATERTKLDGIEAGAEVNVNADWNASSGDAQILNKPSIPVAGTDFLTPSAIASAYLAQTKCTLQTTAPTSSIGDGGVHIVVLSAEPATKYSGYIYMITSGSS